MPLQRGTASRRAHALTTMGAALVLVIAFGGGTAFANGNGASADAPHGGSGSGASEAAPHGNGPDGNGPPGHQGGEESFTAQSTDDGSGGGSGGATHPSDRNQHAGQGSPRGAGATSTPPGQESKASEPSTTSPSTSPTAPSSGNSPSGRSAGAGSSSAGPESGPAQPPPETESAPPAGDASTSPGQALVAHPDAPTTGQTPAGAPPTSTLDVAELLAPQAAAPEESAASPPVRFFERAAEGTARTVDTVLSPGRDFGVPILLMAILGMYLAFQRRLDRGRLPMSGLSSAPDGDAHVRYEL